jgi:hypothetical protein
MLQTAHSLGIVQTPARGLRHIGQQCTLAFFSDLRDHRCDKSGRVKEGDRGTRVKSASLECVLAESAGSLRWTRKLRGC